jgi:predicted SprT family Zn-dependent metalloprotease
MSGLSHTPGKRARVNSPPRVRIPPSPPGSMSASTQSDSIGPTLATPAMRRQDSTSESLPPPIARSAKRWLQTWGERWGQPDIADQVSISMSTRLRSSWGRVSTKTGRITIKAELALRPKIFKLVLCHEVAHVVASARVGRAEGPHGETWQRLVRIAGLSPSSTMLGPIESGRGPSSNVFLHVCMVCNFSRLARRKMTQWRCADCVAAGQDGELTITLLETRR